MSYVRPMGDGPITDPSQVDDTIVIGETTPKRVTCDELPADSPWRKPGQVCAPQTGGGLFDDLLKQLFPSSGGGAAGAGTGAQTDMTTAPGSGGGSGKTLLLLGAAGLAAYYLFGKRRK